MRLKGPVGWQRPVSALFLAFVAAVGDDSYARAGWPGSAYKVSKAALNALTRLIAGELGERRIKVNAVCPGPTETAMIARIGAVPEVYDELRRRIPLQRWGRPEEMAGPALLLASEAGSYITGSVLSVDGGCLIRVL